ncbi:MAG: hypothetical protein ACOYEG_10400 [Petrimonas sp.]
MSLKRSTRIISRDKNVVVLMDATYWGKSFGVVVMKDSRTGKILWCKFIYGKETLSDYKEGIDRLGWHYMLRTSQCISEYKAEYALFMDVV